MSDGWVGGGLLKDELGLGVGIERVKPCPALQWSASGLSYNGASFTVSPDSTILYEADSIVRWDKAWLTLL